MLILASRSPRRIDILKKMGYNFKIIPADINEEAVDCNISTYIPLKLAELKAESVGLMYPTDLIIGMDTMVFYKNKIFGKPNNDEEAELYLKTLSGKWHSVISGVCILSISKSKKFVFSEQSKVKFKKLKIGEIKKYLDLTNPLDKAGGYAIQEYGDMLIEKVVGSIDNIIGFPTEKFLKVINII